MPDPTPPIPPTPPGQPAREGTEVHAAPGASVAVTPPPERWTLGLTGVPKLVANVSAVGFVFILFWNLQSTATEQAREDRTMFRDELRVMHDDSARKWEAINRNQQTMTEVSGMAREGQRATVTLTDAIKTLTEEVRKLKDETEKTRKKDEQSRIQGAVP